MHTRIDRLMDAANQQSGRNCNKRKGNGPTGNHLRTKRFERHICFMCNLRPVYAARSAIWAYGLENSWCPGRDLNPHSSCEKTESKSYRPQPENLKSSQRLMKRGLDSPEHGAKWKSGKGVYDC